MIIVAGAPGRTVNVTVIGPGHGRLTPRGGTMTSTRDSPADSRRGGGPRPGPGAGLAAPESLVTVPRTRPRRDLRVARAKRKIERAKLTEETLSRGRHRAVVAGCRAPGRRGPGMRIGPFMAKKR